MQRISPLIVNEINRRPPPEEEPEPVERIVPHVALPDGKGQALLCGLVCWAALCLGVLLAVAILGQLVFGSAGK